MGVDAVFNLIALVYALLAIQVVRRVRAAGTLLFDDEVTTADRRLIFELAFFVLTPPAVALHELGHAAATWLLGGHVEDFWFAFYWGSVLPARIPLFSPGEYAFIAAAGPLVTVLIGAAAIAWAVLRPGRPARNLLLLTFGQLQLIFGMVFYPLISLPTGFGDFHILRTDLNDAIPQAGNLVSAAFLLGAFLLMRYRSSAAWKRRLWRLTSSNYAELESAERRLAENPADTQALKDAAYFHLSVDDAAGAIPLLARAVSLTPGDPVLLYNLAVAEANDERHRTDALAHAREAARIAAALPPSDVVAGFRADVERLVTWLEAPDPERPWRRPSGTSQRGAGTRD
ncbi:MAG: hypothetical protein ACRDKW_09875 [Actinomycetota bacterium]